MTQKNKSIRDRQISNVAVIGFVWYLLVIILVSFTPIKELIFEKGTILLLPLFLLVGSSGIGYLFSWDAKSRIVRYLGAVCIGILLVVPGFFLTSVLAFAFG